RLPVFAVNESTERALDGVVAERLRLAEQERRHRRQLCAPVDSAQHGVDEVIEMNERLPVRDVARIERTRDVALMDALDLMDERDGMTAVVVNSGDSQESDGDV